MRFMLAFAVFVMMSATAAEARRVALVIGQNAYTAGLQKLANPALDAERMAALLGSHGFDVIACDGKRPGCFDLNREGLLAALARLETEASGADLTLVFFAGHGVATQEGNILAPTDARVNCDTGAVTHGVPVERMMQATSPARHKFLLLDACRDNPLGVVCPNLKGKTLSFTRIEAGAMQGLLLVTSTQFGQRAKDGLPGAHSPFAAALFAALEANPGVYFEQVMNEVARATYDAVKKLDPGFDQIPGRVVGGAAPADCLAGKDCIGDARMAALAQENERLAVDAAGVRNILGQEEAARGKPYTAEERAQRMAQLQATLASIGASTDPLRQEGRRLIDAGNVDGGKAKLEAALEADEKASAEAKRIDREVSKAGARGARDLGVLASGHDAVKAMSYYSRAMVLDPDEATNWQDYALAALEVGRLAEAKTAFAKAVSTAQNASDAYQHYWAMIGLGDVAVAEGSLPDARRAYETASAIAEPLAKTYLGNARWQRNLSVSHNRIGEVLRAQGNLPAALENYRASLAVAERLAKAAPGNAGWQRDLSVSQNKIGDVFAIQGNLPAALENYRASHDIFERLAKANPGNADWQRNLSVSRGKIGDMLAEQGNLTAALENYRASLDIFERLAKAGLLNTGWQRDLSVSQNKIGDVLRAQDNLPAALESYQASLAVAERLIKAAPGNAGWQRDLAISHGRVAVILALQGQDDGARTAFREGRAIIDKLRTLSPDNAMLPKDLAWFDAQLAALNK